MRVQSIGSMGDEMAMTAAIREAKLQRPDEMIMLHGRWNPDIWENCPWLNIGNQEDGLVTRVWSFYRTHKGSRTRLYFKLLGLDPAAITDDLPEFFWKPEELAAPIMVKRSKRKRETEVLDLEVLMEGWPKPVIAIDPGAGWPSRQWPFERFGALAVQLRDMGYQVVQIGSGRKTLPGVSLNLVGRLKLRAVARFLGRCTLYIGNDSGYFHVAAAVGCPHVTVYGPTRDTCGPYPTTVAVNPEVACSRACFEFCGRKVPCEGDSQQIGHCMEAIPVDAVLAGVKEALARPRPRSRLVPALTKKEAWDKCHAPKHVILEGAMETSRQA